MSSITVQADLACPPRFLFNVLSDPAEIPTYFPFDGAESECRVGGRIVLRGQVNGAPFTDTGTITAYAPDREFAYRYWSSNHGTEQRAENEILIQYRIEAMAEGCRLTITQSNLPSEPYRAMMEAIWPQFLTGFKAAVEAACA